MGVRGLADGDVLGAVAAGSGVLVAALSGRVLVPMVRVGVGAAVRGVAVAAGKDGPALEAVIVSMTTFDVYQCTLLG